MKERLRNMSDFARNITVGSLVSLPIVLFFYILMAVFELPFIAVAMYLWLGIVITAIIWFIGFLVSHYADLD